MPCPRCQFDLPDTARFCPSCGAAQQPSSSASFHGPRLTRRPREGQVAGVCAGLADYLHVDVTLVRVLWVILSVVPGMIVGGILAYLLAWLVMPEGRSETAEPAERRLMRSNRDSKIGGVCGGLAEYLNTDSTAIRLLWLVLTILPGAIVGGILVYLVAWLIIPRRRVEVFPPSASTAGSSA